MSKKPRLALIGTGWAVRVQLPSFRAAGWDVTVLWARTEEKAKAYAAQYNIPFGTSSYDEVLANNTYDLVSGAFSKSLYHFIYKAHVWLLISF
mmetsp:Transcript_9838/g.10913  ORF Transcript_9838/g.10913 Transcript_9838/m.10913 type:complete len:93 (+) Transcript_9838:34-312(+)